MPSCSVKAFIPNPNAQFQGYTYETLLEIVNYLKGLISFVPKVGIICGSGISSLTDALDSKIDVAYEKIPHFPSSTVQGHGGSLVFGYLSGVPVVGMKGRFHYYEGYPLWKCVMPVRVMKLLGVSHLIVTNAAGGLSDTYKVGDVVLIKDHINFLGFAGNNALQGPNEERFGPRFPAMNDAYDKNLRNQAKIIAREIGLETNLHEGVYACLGGPNYETIAELKMLKMLGVDTVGMSTVHEVITAVHCGLKVFGFSLVTNISEMEYDSDIKPNHEEVLAAARTREDLLKIFVRKLVEYIGRNS